LGFYATSTDHDGLASFELPKGKYDVQIWTDGYKAPPMTVDVSEDITLQVEALKTLTEAEVEEKIRRLEASMWG
jgi:hypothetical protein